MHLSATSALTDLILEVFQLNGRLLAAGDALVRDLGLTSARWQVLGAAAMSPVPLPVASIARIMGLTRQSVQRIINELEAQGIITLELNPHHQRAKLVVLTERGRTLFAEATARQRPWAAKLSDGLEEGALRDTGRLLRELRGRLNGPSEQGEEDEA